MFRSPVILHNAGQIRLELTAEDIQLDCACHSVAPIRARARVFVFAVAEGEKAARSVSLWHLHLFLHRMYHRPLQVKYRLGRINV